MTPTIPDLVIAVGVSLVVAAVAALAGGWWATILAGVVLIWVGYVLQLRADTSRQKGGS